MEQNLKENNSQPMKKRVFSEKEQNRGSYNVGMKSNHKKLAEKVNKHLSEVNENLNLDAISQEELISKKAFGQNKKSHKYYVTRNVSYEFLILIFFSFSRINLNKLWFETRILYVFNLPFFSYINLNEGLIPKIRKILSFLTSITFFI